VEHYQPLVQAIDVPSAPVSVACGRWPISLDTLTGFWAMMRKPDGSKESVCAALGPRLGLFGWCLENEFDFLDTPTQSAVLKTTSKRKFQCWATKDRLRKVAALAFDPLGSTFQSC